MNIKCLIGIHGWKGCRCAQCGKTRTEGHDWAEDCEACSVCKATRQDCHDWDGCRCKRCGKVRDAEHEWEGCRCARCGLTRDEGHDWEHFVCRTCGAASDDLVAPWLVGTWTGSLSGRLIIAPTGRSSVRFYHSSSGDSNDYGKVVLNGDVAEMHGTFRGSEVLMKVRKTGVNTIHGFFYSTDGKPSPLNCTLNRIDRRARIPESDSRKDTTDSESTEPRTPTLTAKTQTSGRAAAPRSVDASCDPVEEDRPSVSWRDVHERYGQYISGDPVDDQTFPRARLHTFYRDYGHADSVLGHIADDAAAVLRPTNEGISRESGTPKYHIVHEGNLTGRQIKDYLITVVAGGGEIWEVLL